MPEASDRIKSEIQASEASPNTSRVTSKPSPDIVEPVKLNPITVLLPVDTVNPASPAAPPPAPVTSTPVTLNWKPAIGVSVLNKISTLPPG